MNNTRARVDVNLIGGIQFKHKKNCQMFVKCNDWVCSNGLWTLFLWYVMERELLVRGQKQPKYRSRNLPKTQHTSYTHTLTLLKYFSSASHNIILSLSYDLISYTLFLLFLNFFLLFYVFPVYRVHVPYKAVFFLICVLCLKEI